MRQPLTYKINSLLKKDTVRAIIILTLLVTVVFFDVIFLKKTISSIQVPGVMGNGPYGHSGTYKHRALVDGGGSTWGPRPHTILISKLYKDGSLPLWIPYMGTGQPLAANMDSSAFNPLRVFLYLYPSTFMWDMFVIFRLLLAGIFAYLYMRAIQLSHLTSLFSAILFMFSGYFIFNIDMHHLDVEIFLPFVFLCFEMMIQKNDSIKWGAFSCMAIFFTVVGGQPQSAFLILVFGYIYYLFRVFSFRENWHLKLIAKYSAVLALINIVGFSLSSFLLIPFYEFMKLASHNHSEGLGLSYNPHLSDIMSFFVPYYLGPIHGSWLKDYSWHILTRGYVGVTAVLFSFTAVLEAFKSRDRQSCFIVFFGVSLFLMLAKFYGLPLVNWIGKLPIANMINYGKYLGPLYAFCFAVLAGFCLEKIAGSGDFSGSIKKAAVMIIFIMVGTFFYYYRYMEENANVLSYLSKYSTLLSFSIKDLVLGQSAVAVLFIAILIYVYFLYSRRKKFGEKTFKIIVISVALIELFIYMPNPGVPKHRNKRYDIFTKAPYIDFLQKNLANHRVVGIDRVLYPDFASAFDIGDLRVLDALLVKRYMTLIGDYFQSPSDRFTGDEGIEFKKPEVQRILDLMGVKYILSTTELEGIDGAGNIVDDIIRNGKVVYSPGQPVTKWIKSTDVNINGINKKGLIEHAPSKIDYKVMIPADSSLNFSISLLPETWSPNKGEGVLFEILLTSEGKQRIIFSRYINPKLMKRERRWFDISVDLSAYAGKDAILSFITSPGMDKKSNNDHCWAVWGNIKFVKNDSNKRFKLVYNKEILIHENTKVFPRAFVVHDYEVVKDESAVLKRLKDSNFDLRNKIIIKDDVSDSIRSKLVNIDKSALSPAELRSYGADRVEITADMQNPGFLVLSDTYYPGWIAYVDGKETEIFVSDYIFRSVFLDKGVHNITFVYRPLSFKIGLLVGLIALVSVASVLILRAILRRKKTTVQR